MLRQKCKAPPMIQSGLENKFTRRTLHTRKNSERIGSIKLPIQMIMSVLKLHFGHKIQQGIKVDLVQACEDQGQEECTNNKTREKDRYWKTHGQVMFH